MPCRNVNTKNQITLEPESYEICLPDWESVLPGLCALIDAPYSTGAFDEAERQKDILSRKKLHLVEATVYLSRFARRAEDRRQEVGLSVG